MSCERCGGLMVIETFCDLMEEESRAGIETIRCLNCGNFEDTLIRTNRVISRLPRHVEPHTVEGVIAECPRGRAPRLPVGTPSAKTWTLKPARIGPLTPIIQTQRRCA